MTKQSVIDQSDVKSQEFTETSKQIATLIASILHETEPNHVKIQIIKEEIEAGRYQINNEHIASNLLEFASVLEEEILA